MSLMNLFRLPKLLLLVILILFLQFGVKTAATAEDYLDWQTVLSANGISYLGSAMNSNGNVLVTGEYGGHIKISSDSGNIWREKQNGNWRGFAMSEDGSKIYALKGVDGYLYSSIDSGDNWNQITAAGSRDWNTLATTRSGNTIFAAVTNGYIYESIDSGSNWVVAFEQAKNWSDIAISGDGSKIIATTFGQGVYASIDGGSTWVQKSFGTENWSSVTISNDGSKVVAVQSGGYILTSTDLGFTWTATFSTSTRSWISLSSSNDGRRLVAAESNGSIYSSNDYGSTWNAITGAGTNAWQTVNMSFSGDKILATSSPDGSINSNVGSVFLGSFTTIACSTSGSFFVSGTTVTGSSNCLGTASIPTNVTNIADQAFKSSGLTGITLPASLVSIGTQSFYESGLTSVTIPANVTSIGESAFSGSQLTNVIINSTNLTIGNAAFQQNFNLHSVDLGNGNITLGNQAFYNNYSHSLTSLSFGTGNYIIGPFSFFGSGLTRLTIPDGVTAIGDAAFKYSNLATIEFPNTLTTIGESAFEGTALTTVIIPTSVTSIGSRAFANYTLQSYVVDPLNSIFASDEHGVLFSKTMDVLLAYPMGRANESYTVPSTATRIEAYALAETMYLRSVTIPNSVITLGIGVFSQSHALESVNLGEGITSIPESAFYNNFGAGVLNVNLGTWLTSIGDTAFVGARWSTLNIPEGVGSIGIRAFEGNSNLTTVTFPSTLMGFATNSFQDSTRLCRITNNAIDVTVRAYVDGLPRNCPPDAPINVAALKTGMTTASVTFEAPTNHGDSEITSFRVTSTPTSGTFTLTGAVGGTVSITGLVANTSYVFRVTAINSAGASNYSEASNSITTDPPTISGAPIIGTAAALSTTSASVSFTAPESNGGSTIISYTAVSTPGGMTGTITGASSGSIIINGLTASTSYTFKVYATNSVGNSTQSAASNSIVTASATTQPGAPNIGTATKTGATTASIAFTAPASNGGSSIVSYTAISYPGGRTGTFVGSGSGTISITGLIPNTSYTFRVTATNSIGTSIESASSNQILTDKLSNQDTDSRAEKALSPSELKQISQTKIQLVNGDLACISGEFTFWRDGIIPEKSKIDKYVFRIKTEGNVLGELVKLNNVAIFLIKKEWIGIKVNCEVTVQQENVAFTSSSLNGSDLAIADKNEKELIQKAIKDYFATNKSALIAKQEQQKLALAKKQSAIASAKTAQQVSAASLEYKTAFSAASRIWLDSISTAKITRDTAIAKARENRIKELSAKGVLIQL